MYLNNEKPGNHNIYIADKVRGIVKIWNNGIWQSKNMLIIDQIIDKIVKHFNLSIEEIKKDNDKYEKLKKNISNKIQYIQLCDIDYLEDLEDDPTLLRDLLKQGMTNHAFLLLNSTILFDFLIFSILFNGCKLV